MKQKSIRTRLQLVIGVISILPVIIFISFWLNEQVISTDARYHDILKLESFLYDTILYENASLQDPNKELELKAKYAELGKSSLIGNHDALKPFLKKREDLLDQLLCLQKESGSLYSSVHQVLPDLLESVRYIHKHHIAYMKNLLDRGAYAKGYDTGEAFKRSQIRSAPEMDIIAAAISIQTSLLDILSGFYDLQQGSQPSNVKGGFEDRIHRFYSAVNIFEDYSLDAQDGLLVEDLLINGRTFEEWFKGLLTIEQTKKGLMEALDKNRMNLFDSLKHSCADIKNANDQFTNNIKVLQIILLFSTLILALYIFFQNKRLSNEFRRTVEETEKMKANLSYQIQTGENDFDEFQIIFTALNSMAQTIAMQIQELEEAQSYLSQRVSDRTAELQSANNSLQKEIEDHIRSEQARLQLENRLLRVQKMEVIGTLAGGVAHDLNNILAGVVSYPELILLNLPEEHPLRKPLLRIQSSGERAAAIVQDLLTLSRRGVMVSEVVNLNAILQNYLASPEFQKMKSYHPDVKFEVSLQSDPGNILGSRIHLSKTIMNLLTNAAEAMPEGGKIAIVTQNRYVDLPISGYDDVKEGDYVSLAVSDEGTGISRADIERIFEPFFTRKEMGRSGTGLGMSVVWGTVKDHNGYIDVQSSEGHGTTFTLYFPLSRSQLPESESFVPIESYKGNGETILVVDDVEEQRQIATQFLQKLGYSVHDVSSGEAAVEYLQAESTDLVMLDMIMPPGIGGLETYRRILALHPEQKAIIASGFSESTQVQEAQLLGAGCYVKKPYSLEKIGSAVKRELKN
ncbi:MAG: response regulator [Deltaproteobacteria bacterium]|nr:response regulator [Deltaproteobacteria bacterium]